MNFIFENPKFKHIYFIGIGGIGMSGLAELMLTEGFQVSGSDTGEGKILQRLRQIGAKIYTEHKKENLKDVDIVVYTDAISKENEEYVYAHENFIKTYDRATFLGKIMEHFKNSVAVSGTHGKTTTTSMIAAISSHTFLDPTILLGGELDEIGGNIRIGKSDIIVTEACEYKANILKYKPSMAVILNIDEDHLDFYKDINQISDTFKCYADNIPESGYIVYNKDDENVIRAVKSTKAEKISFSIKGDADFSASNINFDQNGCAGFDLLHKGEKHRIKLSVLGIHNVSNALAAIAVLMTYGTDVEEIKKYITLYTGVHRRIESKGFIGSVEIIDDYAHHPTEIMATLKAVKKRAKGRIITIFQPHTYTRTKILLEGFANAFQSSDITIITDIYAAREKDLKEIHSKDLVDSIKKHGYNALYISSFEEIKDYLLYNMQNDDIIITVGAGNIYQLGEELLASKK